MRKLLYIVLISLFLVIGISGCSTPSLTDLLQRAASYSALVSYNMAEEGWLVPADPVGFGQYCYDLANAIKDAASTAGDTATVAAIDKALPPERELAKAFKVGGDW